MLRSQRARTSVQGLTSSKPVLSHSGQGKLLTHTGPRRYREEENGPETHPQSTFHMGLQLKFIPSAQFEKHRTEFFKKSDIGSIQQENIIFLNIYAPNIDTPEYIKEILTNLKGQMGSNNRIAEDFNTPLSTMDGSSRQKICFMTNCPKTTNTYDMSQFLRIGNLGVARLGSLVSFANFQLSCCLELRSLKT